MVLEDGVVLRFSDSGVFGRIREVEVVFPHFRPQDDPALPLHFLITEFLPSRLDGKIDLSLGDDFLRRVRVLDDEVAGVSGKHDRRHGPLATLADSDHFGDPNEMILLPFG